MQRPVLVILVILQAAFVGLVQAEAKTCSVRYLSAEHVYLDSGSNEGLVAGMKVKLVRGGKVFAELEVVYSAGHSASCLVLHQEGELKAGDTVLYEPMKDLPLVEVEAKVDSIPLARTRETWVEPPSKQVMKELKMRGSLALQWDHSSDGGDRDLQTDLLSLPFRIRLEHPDQNWTIRARGSFRQIKRTGFSSSTPASEWRNRIREISVLREDSQLDWNFAFGRISSRATASAGPFDGINISRSLGKGLRLGSFFGYSPRWEDYGFSTDDRVSGMSLQFKKYSTQGNRLDVLLSGVGRYHQGQVSREYLVMTTTWSNASGLSLLQSSELDINRQWRKTAANESSLELSSLALTGRYRFNRRYSMNLGFDNRQPVRTWETKYLPDSLFVDAGRRGWRAGLAIRFAKGRRLNLRGSIRSDERIGQDTKSWNGRLYLPNFPVVGLNTDASVRGFSGPWLSGLSPVLGVGKSTRSGLRLRLEGGNYAYTSRTGNEGRSNHWLKFLISKDLNRHWSVAADFRQDWGEDIKGQRWFLEMRRRF